jgi:uncharacterized protein
VQSDIVADHGRVPGRSDVEEVKEMSAPVTWFEISTSDVDGAWSFYRELFGWKVQEMDGMKYGMVDPGREGAIGGGIGEAPEGQQVVFYIEVDDPQAYLDRIERAGGQTVVPVTEIPDMVTFAQFADPQGNVVGLVKAG